MMCSDVIVPGTDESNIAVSRAKTFGLFLGARGRQGSLATEQGSNGCFCSASVHFVTELSGDITLSPQ